MQKLTKRSLPCLAHFTKRKIRLYKEGRKTIKEKKQHTEAKGLHGNFRLSDEVQPQVALHRRTLNSNNDFIFLFSSSEEYLSIF